MNGWTPPVSSLLYDRDLPNPNNDNMPNDNSTRMASKEIPNNPSNMYTPSHNIHSRVPPVDPPLLPPIHNLETPCYAQYFPTPDCFDSEYKYEATPQTYQYISRGPSAEVFNEEYTEEKEKNKKKSHNPKTKKLNKKSNLISKPRKLRGIKSKRGLPPPAPHLFK